MERSTPEIGKTNDRPRMYHCYDCNNGYEFTELGLKLHRKLCSHQESCICFVCWSKKEDLSKKKDTVSDSYLNGKPANFIQNFDIFSNNKSIESKNFEVRSETPASCQSSHSGNSEQNQNESLSYTFVDPKRKFPKRSPFRSFENFEKNHDSVCNRKIFCVICKEHIFWKSFGTHILQHSIKIENSYLLCPQCNQAYASPNLYLMHFTGHLVSHDCLDCHCDHLKCFKSSNILSPEYSHAGNSTCYICLKTLKGKFTIASHLKMHCKDSSLICKECNRSFHHISNLNRHLMVHRGEKPHKCLTCGKKFTDPATLRNHIYTHTKETPFVCKVCKRGFSQIGNLKRHVAVHARNEEAASYENRKAIDEEKMVSDEGSGSYLISNSDVQNADEFLAYTGSRRNTNGRSRKGKFKIHS